MTRFSRQGQTHSIRWLIVAIGLVCASGWLASSVNAAEKHEVRRFKGHRGLVAEAVFSPDGKRIVSAGGIEDKTVRLWDVKSGRELHRFEGHTKAVTSVAFLPGGQQSFPAVATTPFGCGTSRPASQFANSKAMVDESIA